MTGDSEVELTGSCNRLRRDGLLAGILGRDETTVNALHNQGIDRLASGLAVEATAPDGIIEAVRIEGAESRT